MQGRSIRRVLGAVAVGTAILLHAAPGAVAAVSPQQVTQFLSNPSQILQQFPNGGARMISFVRDLALADCSTPKAITNLLANANRAQQAAVGNGLGQAARMVVNSDQSCANAIAAAVAGSGSEQANLAYAGTTQNTATASTAAGGGGGGGGNGGQTTNSGLSFGSGNSGSGGSSFGSNSSQTASTNHFTGGGVAGASSTSVSRR